MLEFRVNKSTESINGGYVNTLEIDDWVEIDGVEYKRKKKRYVKTKTELTQETIKIDTSKFEETTYDTVMEIDGEMKTVPMTWYFVK